VSEFERIKKWVWLFSGFTETRRECCGTERLFFELRRREPIDTLIEFDEWDADPEGIAHFVDRNAAIAPRIVVVGYSWGGDKAVELCAALGERHLPVRHLVLCDAVWRSGWQPAWMARRGIPLNPLSLTRLPKLKIPASVREVTWLRQTTDRRIRGHDVSAIDPQRTLVHPPVVLDGRSHGQMDESEEFVRACLAACADASVQLE
jgi:pimeloyl-ACP methyl ester carboxylesterase